MKTIGFRLLFSKSEGSESNEVRVNAQSHTNPKLLFNFPIRRTREYPQSLVTFPTVGRGGGLAQLSTPLAVPSNLKRARPESDNRNVPLGFYPGT